MELICERCREYWRVSTNNNVNALYQAICNQHVECVKVLVEEGTDVNHEINAQMTLLAIAVRDNANVEIVKVLIDAGADVNTGAIEPVLVTAVRYDNVDIVKALIDAGADVNTASTDPILVLAVQGGNVDIVKALIDAGADMNPRSYLIWDNALATAVSDKRTECLKMLLDAGADVNHVHNKATLLKTAVSGYDQGMSLLINAGADVNHRINNGESALFYAVRNYNIYNIKCIKLLMKNGAHVFKDVQPHQRLSTRYHQNVGKYQWILFAAGVDMSDIRKLYPQSISAYPPEEQMNLMHLCREAIRKHLLQTSPVNLFVQVPQLGLPNSLQKHLLFNVSLDDDDDEI